MPTALITPEALLHSEGPHVSLLRQAGFEIRYPKNPQFTRGLGTEQETIDELLGAAAVMAGGEYITARVLAALPDLRVVARAGVGYDRVDVPAATAHGVAVTITPTANHEAVAEHALALLLAVAKSVVVGDRHVRAGRWPKEPMFPIRGATLGIFGLGRIGRSMAVRCAALRMRVIATEKFPDQEFVRKHGIELVDFEALLDQSDYLSIHCPANDETCNLFGKAVLDRMKPGSVLINTARGEIVVEDDLYQALRRGHLRGAGLDAFQQEPPDVGHPLFALDNVVFTPHIAGADRLSIEAMAVEAAQCIVKLIRGEWPDGAVVNSELRGRWGSP